jgi:V8-like Glu-specific endopeptidase
MQEYQLLPSELFRSSPVTENDWSVVKVAGKPSEAWGYLELKPAEVKVGDHVNIIQHPGGGPKQISFTANIVVFADESRVQYLTDTLPGSSGSPVFEISWNVVALHHSGGWLTEPNLPKAAYYRNEGIPIARIIQGLEKPS